MKLVQVVVAILVVFLAVGEGVGFVRAAVPPHHHDDLLQNGSASSLSITALLSSTLRLVQGMDILLDASLETAQQTLLLRELLLSGTSAAPPFLWYLPTYGFPFNLSACPNDPFVVDTARRRKGDGNTTEETSSTSSSFARPHYLNFPQHQERFAEATTEDVNNGTTSSASASSLSSCFSEEAWGGPHPSVTKQWHRFMVLLDLRMRQERTTLMVKRKPSTTGDSSLNATTSSRTTLQQSSLQWMQSTFCSGNDLPSLFQCSAKGNGKVIALRIHFHVQRSVDDMLLQATRSSRELQQKVAHLLWHNFLESIATAAAHSFLELEVLDISGNFMGSFSSTETKEDGMVREEEKNVWGRLLASLCRFNGDTLRVFNIARNNLREQVPLAPLLPRRKETPAVCQKLHHLVLDGNRWHGTIEDGDKAQAVFPELQTLTIQNNGGGDNGRDTPPAGVVAGARSSLLHLPLEFIGGLLTLPHFMHLRLDNSPNIVVGAAPSLPSCNIVGLYQTLAHSCALRKKEQLSRFWNSSLLAEAFDDTPLIAFEAQHTCTTRAAGPADGSVREDGGTQLRNELQRECNQLVLIGLPPLHAVAPTLQQQQQQLYLYPKIQTLTSSSPPSSSSGEELTSFYVIGDFGTGGHYAGGIKEVETSAGWQAYAWDQARNTGNGQPEEALLFAHHTQTGGGGGDNKIHIFSVGDNFYYSKDYAVSCRRQYIQHSFDLLMGLRSTKEGPGQATTFREERYQLWQNAVLHAGWGNHDFDDQVEEMKNIDAVRWDQPDRFFMLHLKAKGNSKKVAGTNSAVASASLVFIFANTVPRGDEMGFGKGWVESTLKTFGNGRETFYKAAAAKQHERKKKATAGSVEKEADEMEKRVERIAKSIAQEETDLPYILLLSHYPLVSSSRCRGIQHEAAALHRLLVSCIEKPTRYAAEAVDKDTNFYLLPGANKNTPAPRATTPSATAEPAPFCREREDRNLPQTKNGGIVVQGVFSGHEHISEVSHVPLVLAKEGKKKEKGGGAEDELHTGYTQLVVGSWGRIAACDKSVRNWTAAAGRNNSSSLSSLSPSSSSPSLGEIPLSRASPPFSKVEWAGGDRLGMFLHCSVRGHLLGEGKGSGQKNRVVHHGIDCLFRTQYGTIARHVHMNHPSARDKHKQRPPGESAEKESGAVSDDEQTSQLKRPQSASGPPSTITVAPSGSSPEVKRETGSGEIGGVPTTIVAHGLLEARYVVLAQILVIGIGVWCWVRRRKHYLHAKRERGSVGTRRGISGMEV